MTDRRTVLVIGAASQIGHFLLPRLRDTGVEVLALSRDAHDGHGATWLRGQLPDAMPSLPPLHAVICLGPLDLFAPWITASRLPHTPHVIATSSMSAESKRESDVPAERDLARRLREAETALAATCASRGSAWTLFRPTLIYGAGLDKSLTPIAQAAARRHVFPLPSGRGQRQPVHADDIAAAMVAALRVPGAGGHTFEIGGGERLDCAEMFRRVRRSMGTPTLPVPVPRLALALAARAAPHLRGSIGRLDDDLIADNRDLEAILDVHPRRFQPSADAWLPPV